MGLTPNDQNKPDKAQDPAEKEESAGEQASSVPQSPSMKHASSGEQTTSGEHLSPELLSPKGVQPHLEGSISQEQDTASFLCNTLKTPQPVSDGALYEAQSSPEILGPFGVQAYLKELASEKRESVSPFNADVDIQQRLEKLSEVPASPEIFGPVGIQAHLKELAPHGSQTAFSQYNSPRTAQTQQCAEDKGFSEAPASPGIFGPVGIQAHLKELAPHGTETASSQYNSPRTAQTQQCAEDKGFSEGPASPGIFGPVGIQAHLKELISYGSKTIPSHPSSPITQRCVADEKPLEARSSPEILGPIGIQSWLKELLPQEPETPSPHYGSAIIPQQSPKGNTLLEPSPPLISTQKSISISPELTNPFTQNRIQQELKDCQQESIETQRLPERSVDHELARQYAPPSLLSSPRGPLLAVTPKPSVQSDLQLQKEKLKQQGADTKTTQQKPNEMDKERVTTKQEIEKKRDTSEVLRKRQIEKMEQLQEEIVKLKGELKQGEKDRQEWKDREQKVEENKEKMNEFERVKTELGKPKENLDSPGQQQERQRRTSLPAGECIEKPFSPAQSPPQGKKRWSSPPVTLMQCESKSRQPVPPRQARKGQLFTTFEQREHERQQWPPASCWSQRTEETQTFDYERYRWAPTMIDDRMAALKDRKEDHTIVVVPQSELITPPKRAAQSYNWAIDFDRKLHELHRQLKITLEGCNRRYSIPRRSTNTLLIAPIPPMKCGTFDDNERCLLDISAPFDTVLKFLHGLSENPLFGNHPIAVVYKTTPFVQIRDRLINELFRIYAFYLFRCIPRTAFDFEWFNQPSSRRAASYRCFTEDSVKRINISFNEYFIKNCEQLRDIMLEYLALAMEWYRPGRRYYSDYREEAKQGLLLTIPPLRL